tara:strand:+ start:560 stop:1138 length:579 start_codon:yes stop_codon:yes gene_type:complete
MKQIMKKSALLIILSLCLTIITTAQGFSEKLSNAGILISHDYVVYDGSYRKIDYPNGDVPPHIGVCTDVIIRAYRKVGIDLQKDMHLDIKANVDKYWKVKRPNTDIDHRRVSNMHVFFKRKGKVLPITTNPNDYKPGDIVCWKLGTLDHVGLVVDRKSSDGKRYLVVHNIGSGQNIDDFLFSARIVGHYTYQ